MAIRISARSFEGGSLLADPLSGGLAEALRQIAIYIAKDKANGVSLLTDNSGGAAADGTIGAIPLCTTAPATNDTCPTKAEVEVSFGDVKNALTEIAAKIVTYATAIPAFSSTPTNSIGGTAADGTIAVLDMAFAGAAAGGGTCVQMTGFNSLVTAYSYVIAELARDVNVLCTATGVTPLVVTALPTLTTYDTTYAALSTDTGTAAANGLTSVTDSEAEASFVAMGAAVKELATKLNALSDDTLPNLGVVAV